MKMPDSWQEKRKALSSGRMMWRQVMTNRHLGLPITFALALAVADPSAKHLLDAGASALLQRGALKELLSRGHVERGCRCDLRKDFCQGLIGCRANNRMARRGANGRSHGVVPPLLQTAESRRSPLCYISNSV